MKRTAVLAWLGVLSWPVLAMAQINSLPSAPHLLVKGHAEARYVPDRFTIEIVLDVTDPKPDRARAKVEAYMDSLLKALDHNGALASRTEASSLSIGPATHYDDSRTIFDGTEVSRTLKATFSKLADLQAFLATLSTSEELQVKNLSVSRSDEQALRQRLRAEAVANSRETASRLAKAYGVKIGGVYSISEVAPAFAYGISAGAWNDAAERGGDNSTALYSVSVSANAITRPELRAGTIELSQNMYAVYLIAP